MTDTQLLVGSLSNDLLRAASLVQRGSMAAAQRFTVEAKRWAEPLRSSAVPKYIVSIAQDVAAQENTEITLDRAEKYLMYGVLLQNYSLHCQ